jgi:hypothetical protein
MSVKRDDVFDVFCAVNEVMDVLVSAVAAGKISEENVHTFFRTKHLNFNNIFTRVMGYRRK